MRDLHTMLQHEQRFDLQATHYDLSVNLCNDVQSCFRISSYIIQSLIVERKKASTKNGFETNLPDIKCVLQLYISGARNISREK